MDKGPSEALHKIANAASSTTTGVFVFLAVIAIIIAGFFMDFAQSWQYAVHSGCGLFSVVMLFVIYHTENQQTNAILLKLDELIRSDEDAHDELMEAEDEDVDEQEDMREELHDAESK